MKYPEFMHASLCVTGVLPGLQVSVVPGLGSWDLVIMPTGGDLAWWPTHSTARSSYITGTAVPVDAGHAAAL
jgi:hypothetical protein